MSPGTRNLDVELDPSHSLQPKPGQGNSELFSRLDILESVDLSQTQAGASLNTETFGGSR